MKRFLDQDFLLKTETAKRLYHEVARNLPIIDYHCHIVPQEIYEDKPFESITEAWLGGDHYKWRLMRTNGVPEQLVTGDGDPREKFRAYAEAVSLAIGNPLHHWSNMELKIFFDIDEPLSPENADRIYDLAAEKLKTMTPREMIRMSNVETIVTTDDPIDDLVWHKRLAEDPTCPAKVLPGWRPDKILQVNNPGYTDYLADLAAASGVDSITSYDELVSAMLGRLDYFAENGCTISDHGLNWIPVVTEDNGLNSADIFAKRLAGDAISVQEADRFSFDLLVLLGREYSKRGWVMQYHFNALRGVNTRGLRNLGPDTGFDTMRDSNNSAALAVLLDKMEAEDCLPKTILYSLNGRDNDMLVALMSSFQGGVPGKLQLGSAWWFNDTKDGMEAQMRSFAAGSNLGRFVGMLTDSRSFLSYPRHDYFRRILCNLVGDWVEDGEYPNDPALLERIVAGVSYRNAKEYFDF